MTGVGLTFKRTCVGTQISIGFCDPLFRGIILGLHVS